MHNNTSFSSEVTKDFYNSDSIANTLNHKTKDLLKKLDGAWDELGIEQDTRSQRGHLVLKHIEELYEDILTETQEEKETIVKKIAKNMEELEKIKHELQMRIPTDHLESIPLYTVHNDLEKILNKHKSIHEKRKEQITELLKQEVHLCNTLGKTKKCLPMSPLPSEEELSDFRNYLEELSNEKFERTETFIKAKSTIVNIIRELNIKPDLHFEKQVVLGDESQFEVTTENMIQLATYQMSLETQLEEMRAEIAELRKKLSSLWERLEESPMVRSAFLEAHPGNSVDTLRALKVEVARCEEKKMANIKIFVDKTRQDLKRWWDLCRYSQQQRAEFIYYTSKCYTEDLLSLHEIQVEILSKFYKQNHQIFELISRHEELFKKMVDLERRSNTPGRFKNRGGELLREEKERKAVAFQLPKIEAELLALVEEYETTHKIPFNINGQHVKDVLGNAWQTHKENKQLKLSEKKQERENIPRTPLKTPISSASALLTPHLTNMTPSGKRKLATPLFGSAKKANTTPANAKKSQNPKIQINGSTIKRASLERRKRIERRRPSKPLADNSSSSVTDYDVFELRLKRKPTCRSTLFNNQVPSAAKPPKTPTNKLTPSKSRSRTPMKKIVTPTRTPGRLGMTLRPKSPGLPIIF